MNEVEAALRALRDTLRSGGDVTAAVDHLGALLESVPPTQDGLDEVMQALFAVTDEALDELGPLLVALEAALPDEARRGGVDEALGPLFDALHAAPHLDGATLARALARATPPDPELHALRAAIAELQGDDLETASRLADAMLLAERTGDRATAAEHIRALQAIWIRRGDWTRVRALARRLANLARLGGDPSEQVLAGYEEALACSRLGRHREAEQIATDAHHRALRDASGLAARGELVLGLVLAPADIGRARIVWHEMIVRIPERPGFEPLGARAALQMADSLAGEVGSEEARADLYGLALEIALEEGDADLLFAARSGLDELTG